MKQYMNGVNGLGAARTILGVHVKGHTGKFARCMGKQLSGQKPGNRVGQIAAWRSAVNSCK
jgi:hypothetical protein